MAVQAGDQRPQVPRQPRRHPGPVVGPARADGRGLLHADTVGAALLRPGAAAAGALDLASGPLQPVRKDGEHLVGAPTELAAWSFGSGNEDSDLLEAP